MLRSSSAEPPASKGAAPPIKPDGIAADEPPVLDPGAMMLIAEGRRPVGRLGWSGGRGDESLESGPRLVEEPRLVPHGQHGHTHRDQLAEFRDVQFRGRRRGGATKYWDDVKDPTVVQYFRITSKTHADEYERVLGAFMLTLDPSAFTIHSVDRVQNLSLWKTYAAKRAATCPRGRSRSRRRFVRLALPWVLVCVEINECVGCTPWSRRASMAWRLTRHSART